MRRNALALNIEQALQRKAKSDPVARAILRIRRRSRWVRRFKLAGVVVFSAALSVVAVIAVIWFASFVVP